MYRYVTILFAVFSVFFLSSCDHTPKPTLADRLEGTWKSIHRDKRITIKQYKSEKYESLYLHLLWTADPEENIIYIYNNHTWVFLPRKQYRDIKSVGVFDWIRKYDQKGSTQRKERDGIIKTEPYLVFAYDRNKSETMDYQYEIYIKDGINYNQTTLDILKSPTVPKSIQNTVDFHTIIPITKTFPVLLSEWLPEDFDTKEVFLENKISMYWDGDPESTRKSDQEKKDKPESEKKLPQENTNRPKSEPIRKN